MYLYRDSGTHFIQANSNGSENSFLENLFSGTPNFNYFLFGKKKRTQSDKSNRTASTIIGDLHMIVTDNIGTIQSCCEECRDCHVIE